MLLADKVMSEIKPQQNQQYKLQIVEGEEGISEFGQAWDDLFARADQALPFLSRAWVSTVIREGRIKGAPLFILAWRRTELVALFPLAVRERMGIKIAVPIGTGLPSYLGLLVDMDYPGVVNDIADMILSRRIADVIHIRDLSSIDRATNALLAKLEKHRFSVRRVLRNPCLFINLECSFDEYLKTSKSTKQRKKLRKEARRLSKHGQVKHFRYEAEEISPEILSRIAEVQEQSWMKRRGAAHLSKPFYKKLMFEMAQAGFGRVWLMTVNGEDAAFKYALMSHDRLYLQWTAFKLKYASSVSVGKILTQEVIRDACDKGIISVDFGQGDAPHKRFWANECYSVYRMAAGRGFKGQLMAASYYVVWRLGKTKWIRSFYHRVRRILRRLRRKSSDS